MKYVGNYHGHLKCVETGNTFNDTAVQEYLFNLFYADLFI